MSSLADYASPRLFPVLLQKQYGLPTHTVPATVPSSERLKGCTPTAHLQPHVETPALQLPVGVQPLELPATRSDVRAAEGYAVPEIEKGTDLGALVRAEECEPNALELRRGPDKRGTKLARERGTQFMALFPPTPLSSDVFSHWDFSSAWWGSLVTSSSN